MGTMLGAGVLLIAYSPVTCVILGYTARRSALLVLTIARRVRPPAMLRRGTASRGQSGLQPPAAHFCVALRPYPLLLPAARLPG